MLRRLSIFTLTLISLVITFSTAKADVVTLPSSAVGDINGDFFVDLKDAIIALKSLTGINPPEIRSDYKLSNADVNENGKISLEDVLYTLQLVAGLRHTESPLTIFPPTGFAVTATSSSQIDLSWFAATGTVTGIQSIQEWEHF